MVLRGEIRILPDQHLAARRRGVAHDAKAADAVPWLVRRVVGVEKSVGCEARVDGQADQPALAVECVHVELDERRR